MPWDTTELWIGDITDDGSVINSKKISGGREESVICPKWAEDGSLYFISDKSGWWNLYRYHHGAIESVLPMDAEFGFAQWGFGMSSYEVIGKKLLAAYQDKESSKLTLIDPAHHTKKDLHLPGTSFGQIRSTKNFALFIQGSTTLSPEVVKLDLSNGTCEVLAKNKKVDIDESYFSLPQHISFSSANGRTSYGYYYPPKNRDYQGLEGELPPLIVKSHGGPTAETSDVFNLKIQYWTSRGFAVLDVDYGGSTGYGREYRRLLNDAWGLVDREDVEHGAQYLVKEGLVDPKKLAITGEAQGDIRPSTP